jgi:hypothetical protein
MFIGHFAVGFAAKQATPRVSLAVLFVAAQLADLLWPVFLMLGLEQVRIEPGNTAFTPLNFISYPYSHSLLMLVVWGVVFAFVFSREVRLKADATRAASAPAAYGWSEAVRLNGRTFLVLFALVVSHWVLDFVTHRPDMPLYPGGPKLGLELWAWVPATMAVEVSMFLVGLWMYSRATRARDKRGRWGLVSFAAFLVVGYIAAVGGPPPPTVGTLAASALLGFVILMVWSWWADRHREAILRTR